MACRGDQSVGLCSDDESLTEKTILETICDKREAEAMAVEKGKKKRKVAAKSTAEPPSKKAPLYPSSPIPASSAAVALSPPRREYHKIVNIPAPMYSINKPQSLQVIQSLTCSNDSNNLQRLSTLSQEEHAAYHILQASALLGEASKGNSRARSRMAAQQNDIARLEKELAASKASSARWKRIATQKHSQLVGHLSWMAVLKEEWVALKEDWVALSRAWHLFKSEADERVEKARCTGFSEGVKLCVEKLLSTSPPSGI